MSLFSYSNSTFRKSLSVQKATEFLQTSNLDEIEFWRKSSQFIADQTYNRQLTFSSNVFIPLTYLCRNNCRYCGYHHEKFLDQGEYIGLDKIIKLIKTAKEARVSEVLITMGEKPEEKYPKAKQWLKKHNFSSTIELTHFVAEKALAYDLLPHINAGSLSYDELADLREISASMGVMIEINSTRLTKKGMVHENSPDKHPKKRLLTIKNAGRLKIPFTSGILVGIGETPKEIIASLYALKNVHKKFHHIQEVIIQNFQPHPKSIMANIPSVSSSYLKKIIIMARHILPSEISIQVPPNLIRMNEIPFIKSGISDWGGISSITHDYINPKHPWPTISSLKSITQQAGYKLQERLPVYPRYINLYWLSQQVYNLIITNKLITKDGFRQRLE